MPLLRSKRKEDLENGLPDQLVRPAQRSPSKSKSNTGKNHRKGENLAASNGELIRKNKLIENVPTDDPETVDHNTKKKTDDIKRMVTRSTRALNLKTGLPDPLLTTLKAASSKEITIVKNTANGSGLAEVDGNAVSNNALINGNKVDCNNNARGSKNYSELEMLHMLEDQNLPNQPEVPNQEVRDIFVMRDLFEPCERYPKGYASSTVQVDYVRIRNSSMATLKRNTMVDDIIINGFFALLSLYFRRSNVLHFNSQFSESLNAVDFGRHIEMWGTFLSKIWEYDIWVMPVHQDEIHWTLMLVLPSQKKFVYLDSMLGDLPVQLLNHLCRGMAMFSDREIRWEDWVLYKPNDVPDQRVVKYSTNNCGLHVCCWAYLVYSGVAKHFDESLMHTVRKNIAQIFIDYQSSGCTMRSAERADQLGDWRDVEDIDVSGIIRIYNSVPDVRFASTIDFCASLVSQRSSD